MNLIMLMVASENFACINVNTMIVDIMMRKSFFNGFFFDSFLVNAGPSTAVVDKVTADGRVLEKLRSMLKYFLWCFDFG